MATNLIAFAGMVIGAVTLLFLIRYVRATKQIAKAAVEQAEAGRKLVTVANDQLEGLSKPVVVVDGIETGSGNFFLIPLRNIGTGSALVISGSVTEKTGLGSGRKLQFASSIPFLEQGGDRKVARVYPIPLGFAAGTVECTYFSTSGAHYLSTSTFEAGSLVGFAAQVYSDKKGAGGNVE